MRIVYFDTETTGLNPKKDKIIELALYIVEDKHIMEKYDKFVNIGFELPEKIIDLTGITNEMLRLEGVREEVLANDLFNRLSSKTLMVAHNTQFDLNFIYELLVQYYPRKTVDDLFGSMYWLDTLTVFKDRKAYPHKLHHMVEYYDLGDFKFHRAIDDASVLPVALSAMHDERGDTLEYVNVFGFNPKYGVMGKKFDFIRYVRQDYSDVMVKSKDILPYR